LIQINLQRLQYLLDLYQLSRVDFMTMLNVGYKKELDESDVFIEAIDVKLLKRIDKFFEKGLLYYIDDTNLTKSPEASVFFRKAEVGQGLDFKDKKIVQSFEEQRIHFGTLAKLASFDVSRKLPVFSLANSPQSVADQVRIELYPKIVKDPKAFLRKLLTTYSNQNIFVFEYIDTKRTNKTQIDGFFLSPNAIVLKRSAPKREIFTLAHELGHYLLNQEEVDKNISDFAPHISDIENWCNDFAWYFLVGASDHALNTFDTTQDLDVFAKNISDATHLSKHAVAFRLYKKKRIGWNQYANYKRKLDDDFAVLALQQKEQAESNKEAGITTFGTSKPIHAPLIIDTLKSALYRGVIDDMDVMNYLNYTDKQLDKLFS
jgi:Zn-dependent peptidase ImmA (M78 family)